MSFSFEQNRRRAVRHAPPTTVERVGLWVLAAAAAAVAIASGARPTGSVVGDVLLTGGFAVAVVAAGSVARRWTWVWATGGVALAAAVGGGPLLLAGLALESLALAALLVDLPMRRLQGAALSAGAVLCLLHLPAGPFLGASALAGAAATAPVLVSGWRLSRSVVRRRLKVAAEGAALVTAVAVLAFVVTALEAHRRTESGGRLMQAGRDAAQAGDAATAAHRFRRAAEAYEGAHRLVGAWWAVPARAVPLVGQQAAAVGRLTGLAVPVADQAASAASAAGAGSLDVIDGRVDVDALAATAAPLKRLRDTLTDAAQGADRLPSPWLLSPVASRVERFGLEVREARADADVAADAAEVLPPLLGRDRPRRYFVILATPAETRGLGGFMGNYAELTVESGRFALTRSGPMHDLNEVGEGRRLTEPGAFPDRYLAQRPDTFWQNVTGTPDLPTVARAVRDMWPQSGGGPLDGVLYLDPQGLASLLQLTGPVVMPSRGPTLTPDSMADFLLRGQYLAFGDTAERKDFLLDAADTVFDELTTGALPGPRRIVDLLGPAARSRHIMLYSFDRDAQGLLHRLDLDGSFPAVGDGDFVALTSDNLGPSKLDAYVQRHVAYDVRFDPSTGEVEGRAAVTLRNTAPPGALSPSVSGTNQGRPPGTAALELGWYSQLGLAALTVDGQPAAFGANREYGRWAYRVAVDIPPGGQRVVELELHGALAPRREYELTIVPQPVADPDTFSVSVRAPHGWEVHGGGGGAFPLEQEEHLRYRFSRP